MDLLESLQMEGSEPLAQAKKAIRHTLETIRDNATIGYECGLGSQTFALLTEAAATMFGRPVREVRENFLPQGVKPFAVSWHLVSENKPCGGETVVVGFSDGTFDAGSYSSGLWHGSNGQTFSEKPVMWMIPEVPEESELQEDEE